MRISKSTLENMIQRVNAEKGKEKNQVGSYKLYKDGCGYAVQQIVNESFGVRGVGNSYGMTAGECYHLLSGLLDGFQNN